MAALVKWIGSWSDLKYHPYICLERDEENYDKFQVSAVFCRTQDADWTIPKYLCYCLSQLARFEVFTVV